MVRTQASYAVPYVIINDISIPLKPLSPQDSLLPSPTTIKAWYLAHYGTSDLFELDPKIAATSLEKLAQWWVEIKSEVLEKRPISSLQPFDLSKSCTLNVA